MNTLFGIHNCDTVKKARKWLEQNQIEYCFHDYRKEGVTIELIQHFLEQKDWQTLLNQKSTTWRQLPDATKAQIISASTAAQLMLEQPTLIKRPILETRQKLIVGFNEKLYQTEL